MPEEMGYEGLDAADKKLWRQMSFRAMARNARENVQAIVAATLCFLFCAFIGFWYLFQAPLPLKQDLIRVDGSAIASVVTRTVRPPKRMFITMKNGDLWLYTAAEPHYDELKDLLSRTSARTGVVLLGDPDSGILSGEARLGHAILPVESEGKILVSYDESIAYWTRVNKLSRACAIWILLFFFLVGCMALWRIVVTRTTPDRLRHLSLQARRQFELRRLNGQTAGNQAAMTPTQTIAHARNALRTAGMLFASVATLYLVVVLVPIILGKPPDLPLMIAETLPAAGLLALSWLCFSRSRMVI
jgi:hypothetical protein